METRSNTLTGAGVTMGERPRARDVEFSAYMEARQPSLLRTAYLLTGDRHTAEDLVQTALAKLYLSWDKVQRRDSVDGYVRRILVNEHNSLWRRGWKKREHATDEIPESRAHRQLRRGSARRAVGGRADAPPQGAGRGGAPLLRTAVRGRDRRRARYLRGDREVPVQPGAGRPARTRTRTPAPPQQRGGAMNTNHDELERLLGEELHGRAGDIGGARLRFGDVRGRATSIRRRRRVGGGSGVAAAMLIVAVPVGLSLADATTESAPPVAPSPDPTPGADAAGRRILHADHQGPARGRAGEDRLHPPRREAAGHAGRDLRAPRTPTRQITPYGPTAGWLSAAATTRRPATRSWS